MMTSKRIPTNDIEDVTQDIFIRAFKNLHTFSRKKPFVNWLCIIVLRTCHDYWRNNYKRRELTSLTCYSTTDNNDSIELVELAMNEKSCENYYENVKQKELCELMKVILNKLSLDDRALIEVIYFEGYSFKEAAEKLDWGHSKTRVRAMRVRRKMRKILKSTVQK
jgi:RNA polymerase sigma-70 factor (ECF subfamily)